MGSQTVISVGNKTATHPRVWWVLLWGAGIIGGMGALIDYSVSPGEAGNPPSRFPDDSSILRPADLPALLMFLHPQCPCSRASIRELSRLMSSCADRLVCRALIVGLPGKPDGESELARLAGAIPGVQVIADPCGGEALRFDARTSGVVMLYGQDGALQFHGGITAARGHAGDSFGQGAIRDLLNGAGGELRSAPVFGCPLFDRPSGCCETGMKEP